MTKCDKCGVDKEMTEEVLKRVLENHDEEIKKLETLLRVKKELLRTLE